MSGLLRRLARSAVGPSVPTIHAMARLPYSPAPKLLTFDEMHTPPAAALESPPPLAARNPSAPPEPAAPLGARNSSAPPKPAAPLAARNPSAPRAARAPMSRASGDASQHIAADPPHHQAPAELAASPANTDIVPAPLLPESPSDGRVAQASARTALAADDDAHATRDLDPVSAFDDPRSRGASPLQAAPRRGFAGTASHCVPDALLPPLAAPIVAPPAAVPLASAPAKPASPETASEVHVHIGRIEVTAIQDSAAPQPAARSGRQPMSLDAYLARRDAKRS